MSTAVADVLRRARALVAKGWTQGQYSRDAAGFGGCRPEDSVCWCAMGAIGDATIPPRPTGARPKRGAAVRRLAGAIGVAVVRIPAWNDTPGRTQAEVLDAFDRAIAAEEATP